MLSSIFDKKLKIFFLGEKNVIASEAKQSMYGYAFYYMDCHALRARNVAGCLKKDSRVNEVHPNYWTL